MQKLLNSQTPSEYFKELVENAMKRQGVASSELSAFYLVQLLDNFVSLDQVYDELSVGRDAALAELLCDALESDGGRRFSLFRFTGDLALFLSGFFSDNIAHRRLDPGYYHRMGGYAYSRAAHLSPNELSVVFEELAAKFVRFADVLNEVSEESSLAGSASVLRLYERWLQTGSPRSQALLRREGILVDSRTKQIH